MSITAQANSTTSDRSAVITLTSGNTSVTISVSQKAHGQTGIGGINGGINDWGDGGDANFDKNN